MLSFNIVEWLFNVVELLFDVVGLLFNIVVYQILSWHPRIPQNCINMQNGGRVDFNLTKVKIVIICKQIQWRCLHFSKLIPLVCKTLGFTSWNPWFRTLKPLVLQRETHAFRLWFHAYQETLPFCIFMQWNEYLCKRLGRLLNGLANHSTWGRAGPGGSAPTRARCYIVRWKHGEKKKMKK